MTPLRLSPRRDSWKSGHSLRPPPSLQDLAVSCWVSWRRFDSGYGSCVSLRWHIGYFTHFLLLRGPWIPRSTLILDIILRASGIRQSRAGVCLARECILDVLEMTSGGVGGDVRNIFSCSAPCLVWRLIRVRASVYGGIWKNLSVSPREDGSGSCFRYAAWFNSGYTLTRQSMERLTWM